MNVNILKKNAYNLYCQLYIEQIFELQYRHKLVAFYSLHDR